LAALLVIAGLVYGGVMLFQAGYAQGVASEIPADILAERVSDFVYPFGFHRLAASGYEASPILLGLGWVFRVLFTFLVIGFVFRLFGFLIWGGRWHRHYPGYHGYHGYRGYRGHRHHFDPWYWYAGPVPPWMDREEEGGRKPESGEPSPEQA